MSKKGIIGIVILALIGFGVWYYLNGRVEVADEKEIVKIGVIMPQTGPVAEPGKNAMQGIQLAIENYNIDATTKIQLVIEDSKSNPKDGVSAMNKLVNTDNTKIIIGDIMSSVFLATAPIAEKNKIVLFSPGASAPAVREAGDYIFRNYLSDDFDGKVMASYIFNEKGIKNVAVLTVNNDYGIGVEKTFLNEYKKLGGSVSFNEQYMQGETNFKTILTKLKSQSFEALYLICNPTENGHIVKQMKELNIKTQLFGNLSFESEAFIKLAKGSFDKVTFSAPYFNLEEDKELNKKFNVDYEAKYKVKPDVAAALGFDVALILIKALKKSNYDVSKVKDILYTIKDFDGVTGKTTFDDKGDVLKDIYIKEISGDGGISIVKLFSYNLL